MRFAASLGTLCVLALPAALWGQGYAAPTEQSIIRPAGYGWRNHVTVAESCGCSVPVRADCYDQPCCFRCGLRPLCFLQRVHRMLDCLLPCNKCCGPICCLFGGRCGGCCGASCCAPTCCAPTCDGLPGFSDPFLDDPMPPKPIADPGTEVRYHPLQAARPGQTARTSPPPARSPHSPWKVTHPSATSATPPRPMPRSPANNGLTVIARPAALKPKLARPEQSVLRRTSAEEPAPLPAIEAAQPIEVSQPIIRSQSPDETSDYAIPHNPLRSR